MQKRLVEQKAGRSGGKEEVPLSDAGSAAPAAAPVAVATSETIEKNRSWGEAELKLGAQAAGSRRSFLRSNSTNFVRVAPATAAASEPCVVVGSERREASSTPSSPITEAQPETPRSAFVKSKPSSWSATSPPPQQQGTPTPMPTAWATASKRSLGERGAERKGTVSFFATRTTDAALCDQTPSAHPQT
ncbi:uncharacterized protein ACA1_337280 [Acanthamoeba castellanii str. Neff]|uniref:Uncharacterized protein n=1 Tax=Acanthamoeba castellanii (strain ATCC 30010 / Neff) TaxID=1257118 RepID=L8HAX1_ACACF|nr:uncharacterized protein ACA1_337280 [Acanthamoeba castellanii str. Neff]ELR21878.1 hypothetical protein ACA1_337280 [Acanthamoeba castellanii str. Neff]